MASVSLVGDNDILAEDVAADTRLRTDEGASHGSLLDDDREADLGLDVQSDTGMMAEISAGDDAVSID